MPADHARLTCSGAFRWMACPGSAKLEAQFPRSESTYAAEGTTAHELHELALLFGTRAVDLLGLVPGADVEMAEHVQTSLDWIHEELSRRPGAKLLAEQRLRPGEVIGRDDLWGTADGLILDEAQAELVAVDLKYGAWQAVEVAGNSQLQLYGLGALRIVSWPVRQVTLVITQPRAWHRDGPIRRAVVPVDALRAFAETIKQAAQRTEAPAASLVPGAHCQFCRAAGGCPALAEHALRSAEQEFTEIPGPLAADRIAELLHEAARVKAWAKALEAHALTLAEDGVRLPGWKRVRRRGKRAWNDAARALAEIAGTYGIAPDVIAPRALISPRQVELALKAAGERKPALGSLVTVPDIGWRLVPDSAPGDDFLDAETEFADIAFE